MADSARGQTRRKSALKVLGSLLTELLYCTLKTLWITLVSIVKTFVPVQKKDVRNEVVLVTGAGSGIGRLMSLRFAELGATVRITATLVEKLIVCAVSVQSCTIVHVCIVLYIKGWSPSMQLLIRLQPGSRRSIVEKMALIAECA